MDYEYVTLLYWTGLPKADEQFTRNFSEHLGQGWKEYIRASWPRQKRSISTGGACIMRRPKIDEKLKERIMKEDSCKPECCIEEEETCIEKTLLVLPIYNAYLRKTCYDSEQALRLTFIEVQHYMGRALTWPNK